jgi:hypothetical protein
MPTASAPRLAHLLAAFMLVLAVDVAPSNADASRGRPAPIGQTKPATTRRPLTTSGTIYRALRSRGIVKPSKTRLVTVATEIGIGGKPSTFFWLMNVDRRVKGPSGAVEKVDVSGVVISSTRNRSGVAVVSEIVPSGTGAAR